MNASFWDSLGQLPVEQLIFFGLALLIAFGFEFINGFHDTANAVTTVIYTRTLKADPGRRSTRVSAISWASWWGGRPSRSASSTCFRSTC